MTPLSAAITRGDVGAVKTLLAQGADPCATEPSPYGEAQWTPIIFAQQAEQEYSCRDELYQVLMTKTYEQFKKSEADRNRCGALLIWAVTGGCDELVKTLLEKEYNASAPNIVLSTAAYAGNWEMAKFLTEKGADVDQAITNLNKTAAEQAPHLQFPRNRKIHDKARAGIELLNRLAARRAPAQPTSATPAALPPVLATPIVAVFDLADPANLLDESTLIQLTGFLATALVKTGRYKTIPREQLRARLLEQKKDSYRACMDEACQIELGRSVAAQKSLATQLLKVGDKCALTANLYDLKSETAEKGAIENTGCSKDDLLSAMDRLARQLAAP